MSVVTINREGQGISIKEVTESAGTKQLLKDMLKKDDRHPDDEEEQMRKKKKVAPDRKEVARVNNMAQAEASQRLLHNGVLGRTMAKSGQRTLATAGGIGAGAVGLHQAKKLFHRKKKKKQQS